MSWPVAKQLWVGVEREWVEGEFVKLANLIGQYSRVNVCVCGAERDRVQKLLREATVFAIETDEVWCRDHGPTFLKNGQSGEVAAVDWAYNGWGGKFEHGNVRKWRR